MTAKIPRKEDLVSSVRGMEATVKIRDVADNKIQVVVNPGESAVDLEIALGVATIKVRKINFRRGCVTKYS